MYELYGVVNHLGGMYGGHYTAFARCEDISPSNLREAATAAASAAAATATATSIDVPLHLKSQHPLRSPVLQRQLQQQGLQMRTDAIVGVEAAMAVANGGMGSTNDANDGSEVASEDSNAMDVDASAIFDADAAALCGSATPSGRILSLSDYVVATVAAASVDLTGVADASQCKWLKFDDDFITEVSTATMDTTIVSGAVPASHFTFIFSHSHSDVYFIFILIMYTSFFSLYGGE